MKLNGTTDLSTGGQGRRDAVCSASSREGLLLHMSAGSSTLIRASATAIRKLKKDIRFFSRYCIRRRPHSNQSLRTEKSIREFRLRRYQNRRRMGMEQRDISISHKSNPPM